jgi:hypothetical protein
MRKGYLLVEMIVVLFVLALISPILERFFRTFIYDLPRNSRFVQESRVLNDVARHIRADVVSAKALSESVGDSAEPVSLQIELPEGMVSYSFSNGQISRSSPDTMSGDIEWSVPHGRIEWRVWNRDKTGYAVEISTYIEDNALGHIRKKMANSFLFFAGIAPQGAK